MPDLDADVLRVQELADRLREPWVEPWDEYAYRTDAVEALTLAQRLLGQVDQLSRARVKPIGKITMGVPSEVGVGLCPMQTDGTKCSERIRGLLIVNDIHIVRTCEYHGVAMVSDAQSKGYDNWRWEARYNPLSVGDVSSMTNQQHLCGQTAQFGGGELLHAVVCGLLQDHEGKHSGWADFLDRTVEFECNLPDRRPRMNDDHQRLLRAVRGALDGFTKNGDCSFCGMSPEGCSRWLTEDNLFGCNVGELRAVMLGQPDA